MNLREARSVALPPALLWPGHQQGWILGGGGVEMTLEWE